MSSLFGKSKSKDPKEQVNQWTSKLRSETRQMDRQIRAIQREQDKTVQMLKESAKKSDPKSCKVLAKEIINSRRSIARLHGAKAEINSIIMAMRNQLSVSKLVGSVDKSADIMKSMAKLNKVPEMMGTMREMSKEMMKTGIVEEMMEDAMESLDDHPEMEEEVEKEVDDILFQITEGQLGKASKVADEPIGGLERIKVPGGQKIKNPPLQRNSVPGTSQDEAQDEVVDPDDEEEVRRMQARLHALRS